MPRSNPFPFAQSPDGKVTTRELEELYKYFRKLIDTQQAELDKLNAGSGSTPVDYSFAIEQLTKQTAALNTAVASLQARVTALESAGRSQISFTTNDEYSILFVSVADQTRQIPISEL